MRLAWNGDFHNSESAGKLSSSPGMAILFFVFHSADFCGTNMFARELFTDVSRRVHLDTVLKLEVEAVKLLNGADDLLA
jgi:hypothetical protein